MGSEYEFFFFFLIDLKKKKKNWVGPAYYGRSVQYKQIIFCLMSTLIYFYQWQKSAGSFTSWIDKGVWESECSPCPTDAVCVVCMALLILHTGEHHARLISLTNNTTLTIPTYFSAYHNIIGRFRYKLKNVSA